MLLLFQRLRPDSALYSAELLRTSGDQQQCEKGLRLSWQLNDRSTFWTFAAVFLWGYFNLTTASLLVPLTIIPLPERLYNLMHYGQTASLSSQALLSVLVPAGLIGIAAWIGPQVQSWSMNRASRDSQ